MSNNTITTDLVINDQSSRPHRNITRAANANNRATNQLTTSNARLARSFKVAALAATALFVLSKVTKAVKASVKEFGDFEEQMNKVAGVSNATSKELEALTLQAREIGRNSSLSAPEVAQLQFELAKLGFAVPDIQDMTGAIGDLSVSLGTDLASSAEVAGKTMRQFGLEADQTVFVANTIANVANSSAADMFSFAETMKLAGTTAGGLGFDLQETSAAVAGLANVGLTGTLAGTGLSRVFLELSSSTSKVSRHLQDFEGDADDLVGMLQNLKADGLSVQEIYDDFGQIAGKSALALIDNADAIEVLDGKMRLNLDTLDKMKGKMEKGVNFELKIMNSAFSDLKISIGQALGPATEAAIKKVTSGINLLNEALGHLQGKGFEEEWRDSAGSLELVASQMDEIQEKTNRINELSSGRLFVIKKLSTAQKEEKENLKERVKDLKSFIHLRTGQQVLEKDGKITLRETHEIEEGTIDLLLNANDLRKEKGDLNRKAAEQAAKEATEAAEKEKVLKRQAEIEKKMQAERKAASSSVGKLKDSPEFGPSLDGFEKYNQEKQSLLVDNHLETIQKNADFYDHQQEQLSKDAERQLEIERDRAAQMEEIRQDEIENTRRAEEQKAEIRGNFTEAAFSLLDTYTGARISSIDREAAAEIKAVKNKNKVLTKEDKQIAKIEEDAANRAYKYRIAAHVGNITQAANNGFLAVTNTLANVPAPLNVPASIAVGAVATANVASIAANPPRKLATGDFISGRSGGEHVIVGEAGDEEIFGMGSAGVPRRSKFASEVAQMVSNTTNNTTGGDTYNLTFSGSYEPTQEEVDRLVNTIRAAKSQQQLEGVL